MGKSKKVIVGNIISKINEVLAKSVCSKEQRQGMINATEMMLYEAGSFRGFRYLDSYEVPAGQLPGITKVEDKAGVLQNSFDEALTDKTRIAFLSGGD